MTPRVGSIAAIAIAILLPASVARAQELAPLDASQRAIVEAIPSESIPEPDEHYPTSNEWRHDLYFDAIRDLGGALVGVGTDQCYTLAAVQDAEIVWIVDYDAIVPRVHAMYGVLVRASASPDQLLARFDEGAEDESAALIEREAGLEIARTYRRNRGRFRGYLGHVARLARDGRPTSWLSDPALYARIRALFTAGRVIARTGDVTGTTTLRAVAGASSRLGVPVRTIYFSNAEQFFPYGPGFRANLAALPVDDRTVVLRTFRHRRAIYPDDDTWHYMVHPVRDFLERLALGYRRNTQIVSDAIRGRLDPRGVTTIGPRTPRQYAAAATGPAPTSPATTSPATTSPATTSPATTSPAPISPAATR